jgi:hypothetical protein
MHYHHSHEKHVPAAKQLTFVGLVLNCESESAKKLADLVDLPCDVSNDNGVELMVDPMGSAGKAFGVGTGWRPDDKDISPYVKLFGMLFGLGVSESSALPLYLMHVHVQNLRIVAISQAWATLPAVIGGYIGNPFKPQPWIEDAMAVGQRKGRWPDSGLVLDEANGEVVTNKFSELPVVGSWPRRPLELATLRLQNMLDISIKNWNELAPNDASLGAGVLTQLGGCVVCDESGNAIFEWKDPGICAVCNFEDILDKIPIE